MGFALWVKDGVARAEGTHEYRPMGIAVISQTDLFHARDFRPRRPQVPAPDKDFAGFFAGFFASLGDLNDFLRKLRKYRHDQQTAHPHHHGGVLSNS
jgi:hypothetical protein